MVKLSENFRRVFYYTKEGILIWYLLTCQEQEERRIMISCKKKLSQKALQNVFVLTYDRMRRYEGAWHLERKLLFPAHVFLESEDEEILLDELKKYSVITESEKHLIRMSREDEEFLRILCGAEHHLQMSRGVIRGGVTYVTEGPLKGMESRICKIDRHKRLARLSTLNDSIPAGLEITEKVV